MRYARLMFMAGVVTLLGCGSSSSSGCSGAACVTIQDFSFSPSTLTVKAGTTVTWTNNGPSEHTSTSDTGVWDSGTISAPGGGVYGGGSAGTYQFKFTTPGTYSYHCKIHPPASYPSFTGTITVTP